MSGEQTLKENYALYNGDSCLILPQLPRESIGLSIYSPPFSTANGPCLYQYSSSPQDLSNSRDYEEFAQHYEFIVREVHRLTMPGRMTCVHVCDIPSGNSGHDHLFDLPGEIIRLHERCGFNYIARFIIWKDALKVRNRTMAKGLAHKTIVEDSANCSQAGADYLLVFRKKGENKIPITHPHGFLEYAGEDRPPADILQYRDWKGNQIENRYSHWIWQRYANAYWTDVRIERVLPYREARDSEDEKHVHPLQLDVIDRCLTLWSNPGETVLTPFMGVGSEVYGAVCAGRKGIGCELKASYFRQAVKNLELAKVGRVDSEQADLFTIEATE